MAFTLPAGVTEEKLKEQVQREYSNSLTTISNKRMLFRTQATMLENTDKRSELISLKTMENIIDNVMAVTFRDHITVKFLPDSKTDERTADSMTKVAKALWNDMEYGLQYYTMLYNRYTRGVGVRINIGFDEDRVGPAWKCVDTRQWVPDPIQNIDVE